MVYEELATAADISVTVNSKVLGLELILSYAVQAIFTGTPDGTFKLQASNDPYPDASFGLAAFVPTNWVDVADSSVTQTDTTPIMINYQFPGYRWVRAVFTPNGGSAGTMTIRAYAKGY